MLLSGYFDSIYWPRKRIKCGENSLRLYRVALRHFDRFVGRPATLDDLTDDVVTAFLAHRLDEVSPYTANRDDTIGVSGGRGLAA